MTHRHRINQLKLRRTRLRQKDRKHDTDRLGQMARELEEARKMAESGNIMKSQFLANFSHEIRTPMNAIIGMTDIVLASDINPSQRRSLTIVKNASEALLDIINGVLDLSKIEVGQFELEIRPFELRSVIEKAVTTLGLTATEKGLDLVCHLQPDLPREVLGDPIRLRQILINLMGNALKFTPSGHIRCHCHVAEETEDAFIFHFIVEDSGIGIPVDKQGSIFDDFTQVDSSSTRVFGGTGLGLSISRRFVHLMQGDIWVESSHGQGSSFHFTARMGKISAPDVTHAGVFDHAATVLVVANNPQIGIQIKELLEFWGLDCISGNCMDNLGQPAIDLAILDTDFGDMFCLELLRAGGLLHEVPTIILTQLGDQSASQLQAKIKEILTKPLLQDDLLRALARIFGLRLQLPEISTTAQPLKSACALDILLVEDVATNRELAELLLGKMGHTVHDARDGLDALTLLERRRYDLILMDLQMPVMDGFTAARIIRACEQGQPAPQGIDDSFLIRELREKIQGTRTPIVAMTAHALTEDRQRCLDIGMDGYLTKPMRLEDVHATLSQFGAQPVPTPPAVPPVTQNTGEALGRFETIISELERRYGLNVEQTLPLIENLVETLDAHLPDLTLCQSVDNNNDLTHHAHSIKGVLLNMGLTSDAQAAKNLEDLCKTGSEPEALREAVTTLQAMTEAILTDLRAGLSTR